MGLKRDMKVLDVGCGVGGPAREIAKFADVHITGLNISDYQIERAIRAAATYGLASQLKFVKGDFMVSSFHYRGRCVERGLELTESIANAIPRQLLRRCLCHRSHSSRTESRRSLLGNLSRP